MSYSIVQAEDTEKWRNFLESFDRVDVCQLPEYHLAYTTRIQGCSAVLWNYQDPLGQFCYPLLLTPVRIKDRDDYIYDTGYKDISTVYGYGGPLSTSQDHRFLKSAWETFDDWCRSENVIAEFSRYSLFVDTKANAHPDTKISLNRLSAVTVMPKTAGDLFSSLEKKTRNMIRKAEASGLKARQLQIIDNISEFRVLYDQTMDRNLAPDFFYYDDDYYARLSSLRGDEIRLFGVFEGVKLVAACISLSYNGGALYHLGASLPDFSKKGANNLVLYEMSKNLLESGVKFLNVGGGKTTSNDDPLLRFKKSNATGVEPYYIGKRIVDLKKYSEVARLWTQTHKRPLDPEKLIFYR